uniref:Uncharacterized protein n=1 Tax=Arundo donax TaxID=35708 RepID=A0A0A9BUW5_ARUDO
MTWSNEVTKRSLERARSGCQ